MIIDHLVKNVYISYKWPVFLVNALAVVFLKIVFGHLPTTSMPFEQFGL
jgi:hypothetical protein